MVSELHSGDVYIDLLTTALRNLGSRAQSVELAVSSDRWGSDGTVYGSNKAIKRLNQVSSLPHSSPVNKMYIDSFEGVYPLWLDQYNTEYSSDYGSDLSDSEETRGNEEDGASPRW